MWAGAHLINLAQTKNLPSIKDLMLLGSNSNTAVLCNPERVNKIWDTKECVKIDASREGLIESCQKCDVPHLGAHVFNKKLIINMIELSDAADKHKVVIDTEIEKAMIVHFPIKIDPSDETSCVSYKESKKIKALENCKHPKFKNLQQFVSTVEVNLKHMPETDIAGEKKARKAHQALGTSTVNE